MTKLNLLPLSLLLLGANQVFSQPKPNILFVFIDDMGYGDLSCYGNKEVKTPNIDRLAKEGIQFNQFYVNAPISSPSRVAVTTGQYPAKWGIPTILATRALNKNRSVKDYLSLEAPSVAREFSRNGYYTAHIGKWHMGGGRDIGEAPLITEYGFNESVTQFEGLGERYLATFETLSKTDSTRNLERWSAALGKGEIHWEKRYNITNKYVNRAIMAIESAKKANKPFYINLWPDDVHTPLEPSPGNRGDGSQNDRFNGVLKEMDLELGRIFDYIRNNKELAENTIIIVTSDNGPEQGVGSAGNLRGFKTNLYEGGIREPFIVWFPRKMVKNRIGTINSKNVIAGIDLPPTFLSIAGIKHNIQFDGIDVSNAFLGKDCPKRQQPIMWIRPTDHDIKNGFDYPDLAIRKGEFKLLINTDGSNAELFDIEKDEREKNNLDKEYPEMVEKLKKEVLNWYSKMPPLVKL